MMPRWRCRCGHFWHEANPTTTIRNAYGDAPVCPRCGCSAVTSWFPALDTAIALTDPGSPARHDAVEFAWRVERLL